MTTPKPDAPQVPAHGVFISKEDVAELHEHAKQMAEDDRRCLLEDALVVELDGINPWTGPYPLAMETLADKLIDERMKAERSPLPSPGAQLPSAELVIEICRELYDRFVMGGWEPKDAHDWLWFKLAERALAPAEVPQPGKEKEW